MTGVRAPAAGMDFKGNLCGHESGNVAVTPARTGDCRMCCVKKPVFGKTREARACMAGWRSFAG